MNIKVKVLIACLTVGLLSAGAQAESISSNAGTSASAFLKIDAGSPRAQALGNAYVSIADGPVFCIVPIGFQLRCSLVVNCQLNSSLAVFSRYAHTA